MNDFGHGGSLDLIKALPDNAEMITFEVTDDNFGEIGLSGWKLLLPGDRAELPEVIRIHEVVKRHG